MIPSQPPPDLAGWFEKVNLVERLRETRVFYGFDRLQPSPAPLAGMPDSAMTQLFRDPPNQPQERWLPAIEVFGEGIYIELREDRIRQWQQDNDAWLQERLSDQFLLRLQDVFQTLPPAASRPHMGVTLPSRPQPRARADQSVRLRMRVQHCVPARAPLRVRGRERSDGRNSDLHRGRRFGGNAGRPRASRPTGKTWSCRATRTQSSVVVFCRPGMFREPRRPGFTSREPCGVSRLRPFCRRPRARRSTKVSTAP